MVCCGESRYIYIYILYIYICFHTHINIYDISMHNLIRYMLLVLNLQQAMVMSHRLNSTSPVQIIIMAVDGKGQPSRNPVGELDDLMVFRLPKILFV